MDDIKLILVHVIYQTVSSSSTHFSLSLKGRSVLASQPLLNEILLPRRKTEPTPEIRITKIVIVSGFSAVVAAFLVSCAYAEHVLSGIDDPVLNIAGTTPSIHRLSTLQEELLRLNTIIKRSLTKADLLQVDITVNERINDILKSVDRLSTDFLALPTFPGQNELWSKAKQRIDNVKLVAKEVGIGLTDPRVPKANLHIDKLQEGIEESLVAINKTIDLNAAKTSALAGEIHGTRQSLGELFIIFSLSGIALSIIGGTLSIRAIRPRAEIADTRLKLIEQRSEELEQFSDRVAHDILSPLGIVALGINHALKPDVSKESVRTTLERAQKGLQRVKQIVNDLLEFARSGGHPTPNVYAPVRRVMTDVNEEFQSIAAQASIALVFETSIGPDSAVFCAPGVLMSLLFNLIQNAIKYMGNSTRRRITVRAIEEDFAIRFEVEDTGRGIPKGMETKIFQPYVRAPRENESGLGLGLATVRRLVGAHSGSLGVETKEGSGALFRFTLPKAPQTTIVRDRRTAQRMEASIYAKYNSALANFESCTEDISSGGMKLAVPFFLPVGSAGRVTLMLGNGAYVESDVMVRHSNEGSAGLEFLSSDLDFQAQIRSAME